MMMMETGALPQAGRRMWQLMMLLMTAAALMQSVPGGLALAVDGGAQVCGAPPGALLGQQGAVGAPLGGVHAAAVDTLSGQDGRPGRLLGAGTEGSVGAGKRTKAERRKAKRHAAKRRSRGVDEEERGIAAWPRASR